MPRIRVVKETRPMTTESGDIKLTVKKNNIWDEWWVEWKENGKVNTEKSYYSGGGDPEHKEDCIVTMSAMLRAKSNNKYKYDKDKLR